MFQANIDAIARNGSSALSIGIKKATRSATEPLGAGAAPAETPSRSETLAAVFGGDSDSDSGEGGLIAGIFGAAAAPAQETKSAINGEAGLAKSASILELLLDAGADIETCDAEHNSAVGLAVKYKNIPLLLQLLDHRGAKVDRICDAFFSPLLSPLLVAVGQRSVELVNILLDHGANIEGASGPEHSCRTPLLEAIAGKHAASKMALHLLRRGAEHGAVDVAGNTAMHLALQLTPTLLGHLCYTLAARGASFTHLNNRGESPTDLCKSGETRAAIASIERCRARGLDPSHWRDWSTVSHAWCTDSARLKALTVLLVAACFRRKLWPRLPVHMWYLILGQMPRSELGKTWVDRTKLGSKPKLKQLI
jgi:hypothetical protein